MRSGEFSGSAVLLEVGRVDLSPKGLSGLSAAGQEETYVNNFALTPSQLQTLYYYLYTMHLMSN
jgi:hypothetical protein